MLLKFIFPKNYDFKPKLFGFIDYSTAIIDGIIALSLYGISCIIFASIFYRLVFFISLFLPIILFSVFGFQKENIFEVLSYMIYFILHNYVYLFYKSDIRQEDNARSQISINAIIDTITRFFTNTF